MKYMMMLLVVLLSTTLLFAQQKPTDLDKSPLDVAYYPANYPILKMRGQIVADPLVRIIYSRPQKKGRDIFGTEVKYNEVWRLGANETTEIEFFRNATFGGKKILKGRYSLFCIPGETKWTLVLNKDNYTWGSFSYKMDKDVARVEVPVKKNEEVEALTMYFENNSTPQLSIMWDDVKVSLPVIF